ncbi:MAG: mycofactocin precursor MftA [Ilumatobacteraceae bacterium]
MEHQPTSTAPRDAISAAETAVSTPSPSTPTGATGDLLIAEELLVEEISIDGMCGVY